MGDQENIVIEPSVPNGRYTDIVNATNNPCTVRVLKFLIGSSRGELTAINQYLFQYIITNGVNNELARNLLLISNHEQRHLELLGDAIVKFGGVPKFTNGQGTSWSARNLNYQLNQNTFLNNNIRLEEIAIRNYERAITCVNNESLKELFREIIEHRRNNINIFRSFLN